MYSETLLDHFRNPRNVGELAPPAVTVEVVNPACGDILRLSVRFENGRAAEVRYKTRGCTASIAAGSALTELIVGRTAAEISAIGAASVEEAVGGLRNESKHAAVLSADAARALADRIHAVDAPPWERYDK
jgi:nitrogen fixation NifU-like protein